MGENNGIGWSEETPRKNEHFRKIISLNLNIWKKIINKPWYGGPFTYTYFDINAGIGIHPEYGLGSPIIFTQEAEKVYAHWLAHMIEIDQPNKFELDINLNQLFGNYFNKNIFTYCVDNTKYLVEISKGRANYVPGLLYCDPTGSAPPFDSIADFSKTWTKIDILIYFSATNLKRIGADKLVSEISKINKRNGLIRQPAGCHQWTFVYLTDGPAFEWGKLGLYDMKESHGIEILRTLNFTKDELKNGADKQEPLFQL